MVNDNIHCIKHAEKLKLKLHFLSLFSFFYLFFILIVILIVPVAAVVQGSQLYSL